MVDEALAERLGVDGLGSLQFGEGLELVDGVLGLLDGRLGLLDGSFVEHALWVVQVHQVEPYGAFGVGLAWHGGLRGGTSSEQDGPNWIRRYQWGRSAMVDMSMVATSTLSLQCKCS